MNRSGSVHAVVVGHAMRSSTIDNQSATPLPRHRATTPGMSATRIGASGELKRRSVNRVKRNVANPMPAEVVTKSAHQRARRLVV